LRRFVHPITLSLCLLVGCTPSRPQHTGNDPLSGGPPIPGGGSAVAPPVPVTSGPPPAVPVLSTTPPVAALASGSLGPPLSGGQDLRINDSNGWSPNAGVRLNQPMPAPAPVTPVARTNALPGLRLASFEQAQSLLDAHSVKWQRLESSGDSEWKFSCSVANAKNPNLSQTYEAQARSALAAVQAVLDQIEKDKE
jgi:hypothetical protein